MEAVCAGAQKAFPPASRIRHDRRSSQLPPVSQVKKSVYIEDAAAAVAWVFQNIETHGGDPRQIFVSGHSAGGYLASMVGLDKRWLAAHNVDANRIAGLIPFSGHTITHFTPREKRALKTPGPSSTPWRPCFMSERCPAPDPHHRRPRDGNVGSRAKKTPT